MFHKWFFFWSIDTHSLVEGHDVFSFSFGDNMASKTSRNIYMALCLYVTDRDIFLNPLSRICLWWWLFYVFHCVIWITVAKTPISRSEVPAVKCGALECKADRIVGLSFGIVLYRPKSSSEPSSSWRSPRGQFIQRYADSFGLAWATSMFQSSNSQKPLFLKKYDLPAQ